MSRIDEADLISKFIAALTIFSERSAALEAKVLSELDGMRGDIQQLKQTISAEHNTVSLPQVMEQQRLTMAEIMRQVQPFIVAAKQQQAPTPSFNNQHVYQQPIVPQQPGFVQQPMISQLPPAALIQPKQHVQPPAPIAAPKQEPSFGSEFKLKEGEWSCKGCYVKNSATANVCPCCNTPKEGASPQATEQKPVAFKPQSFAPAPTGTGSLLFGTTSFSTAPKPQEPPKPITFSFKPSQANVPVAKTPPATVITPQKPAETKPADTKPFFGFSPTANQSKAPMFGGGSNTGSSSFSSLANNPSGGTGFLNSSGTNASLFSADPKKFSFLSGGANKAAASKPANEEEGGGENDETAPEEFAPDDSQFKRPDIALPDLINVRTGEEEEETLFTARCRIYRFMGGEVKERGTGDMKVLKNTQTGKVRVVMRREQVLKLCANFSIGPGFEVHTTRRGENVLTWSCNDFSDPEQRDGEFMTLICRFKDVDTANRFKEVAQSVV